MNTITVSLNNNVYSTNYQELSRLMNNDQLISGIFNVNGWKYQQVFGVCVSLELWQAVQMEAIKYGLSLEMIYFTSDNMAVILIVLAEPIMMGRVELVYKALELIAGGNCIKGILPRCISTIWINDACMSLDSIMYSFQLKLYVEDEKAFAGKTRDLSGRYRLNRDKTVILPVKSEMKSLRTDDFRANFSPKSIIKQMDLGKNVEKQNGASVEKLSHKSSAPAKVKNISLTSITERCMLCRSFFQDNIRFMGMICSSGNWTLLHEIIKGICRLESTWIAYVSCVEENPYMDGFLKKKAVFDYKYLRAVGCANSPCDSFCPYCNQCIHNNTMQSTLLQKNEIYRIDNNIPYVHIDQARYELAQTLEESINSNDNNLDLIIGQAGLGKTTKILELIHKYPDKRFIIAEDTLSRKREVCIDSNGALFYFPSITDVMDVLAPEQQYAIKQYLDRGMYKCISEYLKDMVISIADDSSLQDVYYTIMSYLNRFEILKSKRQSLVMTHRALFNIRPELLKGYIVIIDEDPVITCGKSVFQIPIESVKKALDCEMYSEKTIGKAKSKLFRSLITAPDDYYFSLKDNQDLPFYPDEALNIVDELEGNISDFVYGAAFHINKGNGTIEYIKLLRFPYTKVIVMSATADADIYRQYCLLSNRPLRVKRIHDVLYKGKVIQNVSHSLTRREIRSYCNDETSSPDLLIQRIKNKHPDDTVITLKEFESIFGAQSHFGATNGTNRFSGKNIVVVGTYYLNEVCYKLFGMLINANIYSWESLHFGPRWVAYNGYSFKFSTFNDPTLQNIMFYFMNSELEQAVGRARLLDNDVTVTVYSSFPVRQAHIIYDEYL